MTLALRRAAPAALLCALPTSASAQSASGSDAITKLVPEGTCVLVVVPSLDRFAKKVHRAASVWESFDVDAEITNLELPFSPKKIDHARPLAICIDLPANLEAEPVTTLLLPSPTPQELIEELQPAGTPWHVSSEGGYVILSLSTDVKHGDAPAAIASGLPAGEIVARVDVKAIVARFQTMIDAYLAVLQARLAYEAREDGPIAAVMIQVLGIALRTSADSGETLDLALRLDGHRCELFSSLTTLEASKLAALGSKEKTALPSMSRFLDADAPMSWLVGLDPATFAARSRSAIESFQQHLPEPMRAGFGDSLRSLDDLAAVMGNAVCIGGHASSDGIRCAAYLQSKDPKKLIASCRSTLQSIPRVSIGEPKEETIEGVATTRTRLQVDPKVFAGADLDGAEFLKRILGKDGLQLSFATKSDVTAVVLGGDDEYQRASIARLGLQPHSQVVGVERALGRVGGMNPALVVNYDLGKLVREIGTLNPDGPPRDFQAFPNLPSNVTCCLGVDGRTIEAGMSIDVPELAAFKIAWEKALEVESAEPTKKR